MSSMRLLAGTVLVAALATAGCGGDGGGDAADGTTTTFESYVPPTGISMEEWRAQFTAVCEEYEPQQDAIVAEHGVVETPAELVALIDALTPVVERYAGELLAVEVPPAHRRAVNRTYELLEALRADFASMREAAAGDGSGLRNIYVISQGHTTELERLLGELDVPACT